MPAAEAGPATPLHDLPRLFSSFSAHASVLLAVSGGPDSTALMLLAQRWRAALPQGPALAAATVDHRLRPEARAEAETAGRLAARLGLPHAILDLSAALPATRLQEAARHARYERLLAHARSIGADAIATAHTCDDQAETVLFRLLRGSGLPGLAGIPAARPLGEVTLLRPLLGVRKTELIDLCRASGIGFAEDPSNRDPRFARVRMRALLPDLAREGLDAARLARFADRMARADAALEAATDAAATLLDTSGSALALPRDAFARLPEEIALRLLGRAVAAVGTEGPVELGKLESLLEWLAGLPEAGQGTRTLAGALVRVDMRTIHLRSAPARRRMVRECVQP